MHFEISWWVRNISETLFLVFTLGKFVIRNAQKKCKINTEGRAK